MTLNDVCFHPFPLRAFLPFEKKGKKKTAQSPLHHYRKKRRKKGPKWRGKKASKDDSFFSSKRCEWKRKCVCNRCLREKLSIHLGFSVYDTICLHQLVLYGSPWRRVPSSSTLPKDPRQPFFLCESSKRLASTDSRNFARQQYPK